jgi:plasmid stabilization system protein ParE
VRPRYTAPALADLDALLNYIAVRSPRGAERVKARVRLLLELLEQYPHIGQATDDPGIRRLVVSPYPYLIFYEVAAEEIIVHAVCHAAREPSAMPGR